ncbi:ras-related protein Rab-33A isoform X2 [Sturnira hondurensis]|uniref:ras-related protein Rab-33A isoform X2 n=1 Tax=Sturnira hondurensis TaxID=192404 RepID=UPI001878FE89|nr:ras-related protein Rab-33A isoform X2 [Sturnira hondurensis]
MALPAILAAWVVYSFEAKEKPNSQPTQLQTPRTFPPVFLLLVQVWDTAGQERFRKSMVEHYYRNVHAVVFVYDVTKMTSFTNLKMWIQECNGHAVPPLVPKVLVGNKCDLREQIQVPSNLALKFADAHNMLLFETSAKDPKESQNVESIFMCLACRLKAQKSLLYRDTERQQGKVQKLEFPQEANSKTSCPC